MLTARNPRAWLLRGTRGLATSYASPQEKRVYVIAGEASGDAIGAKAIAALQRKLAVNGDGLRLVVRGIGGAQMMARGGFTSLFPMHELSVMGLVEVLPSVLRLRRRLAETLDDIRAFRPHVLLTVDSKGFTFRVQRALASDPELRDAVTRMHYVAPSVWAYRHRQRKTDFRDLQALLDRLFVILPFEAPLFNGGGSAETANDWCTFVGHPAVEDFLELHGVYDRKVWAGEAQATREDDEAFLEISEGGFLRGLALDAQALSQRGRLLETLTRQGRDDTDAAQQFRVERGLPHNAFVVCALVGSRENEVRRTIRTVLEAVDALQRPAEQLVQTSLGIPMKLTPLTLAGGGCVVKRPVRVIFPTITAVEAIVRQEIVTFCNASGAPVENFQILVDADSKQRYELFQSADAAVAVSGTIVTETALAALPTVVIYRANRITEILAKQLSAVQYVSIPNLLLGREEILELLFRDCTASAISTALRSIYMKPNTQAESPSPSQLAMALSTLIPWDGKGPQPIRGSDLVAESIWRALRS